MRGDAMVWVQRAVAVVFATGVIALIAMVVTLASRAETVPPMPIYMGLMGLVALILLAGACLGIISIAISARRGAEALTRLASKGAHLPLVGPATSPFQGPSLREVAAEPQPEQHPARPPRPTRSIVAQR